MTELGGRIELWQPASKHRALFLLKQVASPCQSKSYFGALPSVIMFWTEQHRLNKLWVLRSAKRNLLELLRDRLLLPAADDDTSATTSLQHRRPEPRLKYILLGKVKTARRAASLEEKFIPTGFCCRSETKCTTFLFYIKPVEGA